MIKNFKNDIKIINHIIKTTISKKNFFYFIVGTIVMGFFEMIGILSVIPFISTVVDPNNIFENGYLYSAYKYLNLSEFKFIMFLGILSFLTLIFSNIFIAYMNWRIFYITRQQEHILSTVLLNKYLNNNYSYYLKKNPSELEKNILHEVTRVVTDLLLPGLIALSKLSIIFFISLILFISDPLLAVTVFLVITFLYSLTYFAVKRSLTNISNNVVNLLSKKFKIIGEIFSGIREIKLDSYEEVFTKNYRLISQEYANEFAKSLALGALPRYVIEAIAFGGIIIIVLFLYVTLDDISHIISLIALYALAGYRLLPAAQSIYFAISKYKFGRPALILIYNDLIEHRYGLTKHNKLSNLALSEDKILELSNISFSYNNTSYKAVSKLNINFKKSKLIGIIGPSGSGKSTLMDIILGLLIPDQGELTFRSRENTNFKTYKKSIGYVSQNVFIYDDSIIKNIAFGLEENEIDEEKVISVAKLANIHDFILTLPDKYETSLGRGGSRLSGGQKQRIAIARVLYKNPKLVIFDEATSQLDIPTEKLVLNSIKGLSEKVTIVLVTHRVQILNDCDEIHVINNGQVEQTGNYAELLKTSKLFQSFLNLNKK